MKKIKSIFVLGSTSEIAESICIKFAKNGCKKFHLVSRSNENNKLIKELIKYNAFVTTEKNNLLDNISLKKTFSPQLDNFDLYLILSGTLGNEKLARENSLEATKITITNYLGVILWINAIMTESRINNKGYLWVFSSVAGDLGRPSNYHYGAAKSAITTYCEGLSARCHNKPFKVKIIKPGYIYTRKTIDLAPKILCITPKKTAEILFKSKYKKGIQYIPSWWKFVIFIIKRLPLSFLSKL